MTPGFAKSRDELPWLPYGKCNRVIINSHNFERTTPTLVGGELAIWCPSLDIAGKNTTTLNDLVGTNDGTLTNFAMTGSTSNWVDDSGSGGVRAINFDGTNDFISLPVASAYSATSNRTWSFWYKGTSDTNQALIGYAVSSANLPYFTIEIGPATGTITNELISILNEESSGVGCRIGYVTTNRNELFDGNWHHIAVTANGSSYVIYLDGVSKTLTVGRVPNNGSPVVSGINRVSLGSVQRSSAYGYLNGRLDDIRICTALSAGNVALLASKRGY